MRAPGFDDPHCMERAAELVRTHKDELAAVVVEPLVQGAAGMKLCPPERFAELAAACDETGVLLICDEVATGFGRTGTLFASEQAGLRPDILCLGKGITAGYLPMSATIASGRVFEAFLGEDLGPKTLYHGHSFGGNALAAAVALRHLQLLDDWNVLDNVNERSAQLRALLEQRIAPSEKVKDVRLLGLMGGVELHPGERRGRRVCAEAVKRGVLLRPLGDVVVVMPPLTITADEIERIVDVLHESHRGSRLMDWKAWSERRLEEIRSAGRTRSDARLRRGAGPKGDSMAENGSSRSRPTTTWDSASIPTSSPEPVTRSRPGEPGPARPA